MYQCEGTVYTATGPSVVYMMDGEISFFYNYCNVEAIIASVHCKCHSSKLYMVRWLVKEPFFENVETITFN